MKTWVRLLAALATLLALPFLILPAALIFWLMDLFWKLFGSRHVPRDTQPQAKAASVVIPNWNGRDLLEKYLPSVVAALAGNPGNEIVVVDNGSTDSSAEFVRQHFPQINLVILPKNLGFGGGSNAGFRAAKNDIVVLLNSDMRVAPDFLQPLLDGFTNERVFAVACQIFFSDPTKLREETGLTQAWWANGGLKVRHRNDEAVQDLYPCFYGGGGSCAFDRCKFLELGGFDELLAPFYLEDTDMGYLAWKRGWTVFYQPRSVVYHEHRGTIGKTFSRSYIDGVLQKNFVLFCWKNIHQPRMLASHFIGCFLEALISSFAGPAPQRYHLRGLWRAILQLPKALRSRWHARSLGVISDAEAFRRPLGGYFRDRFAALPNEPKKLSVLFLSPYPICPPIHGGGVFMYQTLRELTKLADVHLVALLDYPHQMAEQDELVALCASTEFLVRMGGKQKVLGSVLPHAVLEFANGDLDWLLHRQIYQRQIDVVQIEYTNMAQYAHAYQRLAVVLFEHDVYFQSIARSLPFMPGLIRRVSAMLEYLRAFRYELQAIRRVDRVQVCSRTNKEYLLSYAPEIAPIVDDNLRAGITTAHYPCRTTGREPETMLFLGSFRHLPNKEAVEWFVRWVLPRIVAAKPNAKLVIVGSDPPPPHAFPAHQGSIVLRGFVENVREPLSQYAVFLCPILSGSGVRVKLLEAFASGIPTVSTRLGAEGLAQESGEICLLADNPEEFARHVLHLFEHPEEAAIMAERARTEVERNWDMAVLTRKLEQSYRHTVQQKRATASAAPSSPNSWRPALTAPPAGRLSGSTPSASYSSES